MSAPACTHTAQVGNNVMKISFIVIIVYMYIFLCNSDHQFWSSDHGVENCAFILELGVVKNIYIVKISLNSQSLET
jgi:hypothetical protein